MSFGVQEPEFPGSGCAVVFGGSGGLGAETAGLLGMRGVDVVLTYNSRVDPANALVDKITARGRRATAIQCDVSRREDVDRVVAGALEEFGRIHTVISAAGLVFRTAPLTDFSADEFRNVLECDVMGFFHIAQAAVPVMRDEGGSIVSLITCAVDRCVPTDALSAVPKAAVAMLTRHVATEEAANGIRANAVGPAVIDGGMVVAMRDDPTTKALLDQAVDFTPLGRLGTEAEVAEMVVFLASSRAAYMTGQTVMVDGGLSA